MTVTFFGRSVLAGALALGLLVSRRRPRRRWARSKARSSTRPGSRCPTPTCVRFRRRRQSPVQGQDRQEGRVHPRRPSGRWRAMARHRDQGRSVGRSPDLDVPIGSALPVPDIVMKAGKLAPASAATMSKDEADKRNKRNAELEKSFNEAKAASDAGNYDDAIAKLRPWPGRSRSARPATSTLATPT